MIEVSDNKHYLDAFNDISETLSYLYKPRKNGRSCSSEEENFGFCHSHSIEEAMDLLKFGDDELCERLKRSKIGAEIEKNIGCVVSKTKYENRVYGCIPNVPNFLKGNPVNMINNERTKIDNKILNIYLNITCNASVEAEEIEKMGIKYLKLIDYLEKRGYRCNLYAGNVAEGNGIEHYFLVKIKTDREPLNLKKMAFPIAHPSMLRRIFFKWCEVCNVSNNKEITHDGYGSPFGNDDIVKKRLHDDLKKDFLIFSYRNSNDSFEDILLKLKKQGINLKEE